MNAKHLSLSNDWGTPLDIIESARHVLGGIDLDPASDPYWNNCVMADKFYTEEDDGLTQPWEGKIFVNPPGGKIKNESMAGRFWEKLLAEIKLDYIEHAIFVCFSLEALVTTQRYQKSVGDYKLCVPKKRLRYQAKDRYPRSPTHGSCIVYVPGNVNDTKRFCDEFSKHGVILN